jgi:hypothetical protein
LIPIVSQNPELVRHWPDRAHQDDPDALQEALWGSGWISGPGVKPAKLLFFVAGDSDK